MNLEYLFHSITNFITVFVVSSARVAVILITVPFFGPQFVQGIIRTVIIFNMSLIVVPTALALIPQEQISLLTLAAILSKEALLGFVMGAVMSVIFAAAESAGSALDFQRGSSISQAFDPSTGESSTTFGILFSKILVYIFFVGGGIFAFLSIVYKSYTVWPIFSFFPHFSPYFAVYALDLADLIMKLTVLISAPIFIVLFFAEFGLGLMNRFAPQLNVFSISMSVKSGLAAFIIIFYIPFLFELFHKEIATNNRLLETIFKIF